MESKIHSAYDSLPDRALDLIGKLASQTTSGDLDYPGEFEIEEIRAVAARSLGIDQQQLLNLTAIRAISAPSSDADSASRETNDEVLHYIRGCAGNRAEQFVLPLTAALCAKEISQWAQRLEVVSLQLGISWAPVRKYFAQLLSYEHGRIGFDLVLFEANLAIDEEFVNKGPLDRIEHDLQLLWKDPEYQSYLIEKYPLFSHHLKRRTGLIGNALEELVRRLA